MSVIDSLLPVAGSTIRAATRSGIQGRSMCDKGRRGHREAGFIIIFGWREVTTGDGSTPVEIICPHCRQQSQIRGRVRRIWATLFFIPIVPLQSVAKGYRFSQCTSCRSLIDRTTEQLARSTAGEAVNGQPLVAVFWIDLEDTLPTRLENLTERTRQFARCIQETTGVAPGPVHVLRKVGYERGFFRNRRHMRLRRHVPERGRGRA